VYLTLPNPDWSALLGGSDEEARWIADRDRKFGMIADVTDDFREVADALEERDALFSATPEILAEMPLAADWYVSLAGYALKTLSNIREGPAVHGLRVKARTVLASLAKGVPQAEDRRSAFADWINDELAQLYPPERRTRAHAEAMVYGLLGGRCLGQGQNKGGDDGVLLLKRLFVSRMRQRGHGVEVKVAEEWLPYEEEQSLDKVSDTRFAGQIGCDFTGGGSKPDIVIRDRGVVIAQGEVKARKDLANVWESWMPQIENHLRSWTTDTPEAARIIFGTLVTSEMIEGATHRGVYRAGFKQWKKSGVLTSAYNTTKASSGDPAALRAFDTLLDALEARLGV